MVNSAFFLKSIWFGPSNLEDLTFPVIFLPSQMVISEESVALQWNLNCLIIHVFKYLLRKRHLCAEFWSKNKDCVTISFISQLPCKG